VLRDPDGPFVQVSYEGAVAVPISVALYRTQGYQPPLGQLPSKAEYEAKRAWRVTESFGNKRAPDLSTGRPLLLRFANYGQQGSPQHAASAAQHDAAALATASGAAA
jgi:hypothetical protein